MGHGNQPVLILASYPTAWLWHSKTRMRQNIFTTKFLSGKHIYATASLSPRMPVLSMLEPISGCSVCLPPNMPHVENFMHLSLCPQSLRSSPGTFDSAAYRQKLSRLELPLKTEKGSLSFTRGIQCCQG